MSNDCSILCPWTEYNSTILLSRIITSSNINNVSAHIFIIVSNNEEKMVVSNKLSILLLSQFWIVNQAWKSG